jgi:Ser/Thr protein kinase RdoA (MazF antagonist)
MKRHHHRVRDIADLRVEHAFNRHLRDAGIRLPEVLQTASGDTVVEKGAYLYEVHAELLGLDLYRDALSWSPFFRVEHARAAGKALAEFHQAAHGFDEPPRSGGVLRDSIGFITAEDPLQALHDWLSTRPALVVALPEQNLVSDFAAHLDAPLRRAATTLAAISPQWTHGDWHASNLTWTSIGPDAAVAEVFDLGLANLTYAVRDLALAIERNGIDWLDLAERGVIGLDGASIAALIGGYQEQRPLSSLERTALLEVLPVVHVEYALSELDYFATIAERPDDLKAAYDYLIGHAAWFETDDGQTLLASLRSTLGKR